MDNNMPRRTLLARAALASGSSAYLLKTNWRALAADAAPPDPVGDLSALAKSMRPIRRQQKRPDEGRALLEN
jgi:hypothetical protein